MVSQVAVGRPCAYLYARVDGAPCSVLIGNGVRGIAVAVYRGLRTPWANWTLLAPGPPLSIVSLKLQG